MVYLESRLSKVRIGILWALIWLKMRKLCWFKVGSKNLENAQKPRALVWYLGFNLTYLLTLKNYGKNICLTSMSLVSYGFGSMSKGCLWSELWLLEKYGAVYWEPIRGSLCHQHDPVFPSWVILLGFGDFVCVISSHAMLCWILWTMLDRLYSL